MNDPHACGCAAALPPEGVYVRPLGAARRPPEGDPFALGAARRALASLGAALQEA
jgi:hypothetical protein